jgi:uncharacterized membrane protein
MDNASTLEQSLSRITDRQLAGTEKYAHLVLTAIGAIFAVALGAMLLEMPKLPNHVSLTVLLMVAIGVAWTTSTVFVLMRRPVLAARDSALGRVSVVFTLLFSLDSLLARYLASGKWELPVWGLLLLAIASALLLRAHARQGKLKALKARLEAELTAAN